MSSRIVCHARPILRHVQVSSCSVPVRSSRCMISLGFIHQSFITCQMPYATRSHFGTSIAAWCFEGHPPQRGSGLARKYRWPPLKAASKSGYRNNAPETSPTWLQTCLVSFGKVHPSVDTSPSLHRCTISSSLQTLSLASACRLGLLLITTF